MKSVDEIKAECKLEIDNNISRDRIALASYASTPFQHDKHPKYKEIIAANAKYTCPKIINRVTDHLASFQSLLENDTSLSQDINEAYKDLHYKMSDEYEQAFNRLIGLFSGNEDLKKQFSLLKERLNILSKEYTKKVGSVSEQKYRHLKRKYSEINANEVQGSIQQEDAPVRAKRSNVEWVAKRAEPFAKMYYEYKPVYAHGEKQQDIEDLCFTTEYKQKTINSIQIKFNDIDVTNQFAQKLGFELVPSIHVTKLLHKKTDSNQIIIEEAGKFCRLDAFLTILEQYAPGSKDYFSAYFNLSSPTDDAVKKALSELLIKKVDLPNLVNRPSYNFFPEQKERDMRDSQIKFVKQLLEQTFQVTEALALFKVYDNSNLAKYFCETLVQGIESLRNSYNQLCAVPSEYINVPIENISDAKREMKKAEWNMQRDQYIQAFNSLKDRLNPEDSDMQALIDKMADFKLEDEEPPTKRTRLS